MRTQSGDFFRSHTPSTARKTRWYLVANRAGAVIYSETQNRPFHFVERIENPKGRKTEGELDSDRPGTGFSSAGSGTIRHSLDKTFHHHEAQSTLFANRLGEHLLREWREQHFDELVIAAEPRFLGMLRAGLSQELKSRVRHEIPHEFVEGSDQEIRDAIQMAIS